MNELPNVIAEVPTANRFLWLVSSYIQLITSDYNLKHGSGLNKLYTITSGVDTLNMHDIRAITDKAEELGIIPPSLYDFMMKSIMGNCRFYGYQLADMINYRIIGISNGDVVNPSTRFRHDPSQGRRAYYVPPIHLIERLVKGLDSDWARRETNRFPSQTLTDLSFDAMNTLSTMTLNEGHIFANKTSFASIVSIVDKLVNILRNEADYPDSDYRNRSRPALAILWVIAKLLMGDLSIRPQPHEVNTIDIDRKIRITDGTLAAIPFPIKQTLVLFHEDIAASPSPKAQDYLNAVSSTTFYQTR